LNTPETPTLADFCIAIRHDATLWTITTEFPDFNLANVDGATDLQILLWELRVLHAKNADESGKPLDDYIVEELGGQTSNAANAARQWLTDPKGTIYKPKKSADVARAFVSQCEPAFEFSTDDELDDQLGNIEWEWEKYIPRGFVTGLVGEQDTGKSTVAQSLCQTRLIGGRWPDGQMCDSNALKLLWIDTDGNLPLFHARLKAWNMPRGRFIFPPDTLQELAIDNPENWRWIERAIEKFKPPLVVIDALSGSHNGKSNDEDSMKVIMKRLHALAQKYKIAVVVIHHLNKAASGVPAYPITIDRLRGSSSIPQFCRSILALTTPNPANPDERRLDVIKLNLCKKPRPVGYTLTDHGPSWGEAPEPAQPRRAADDASDFLREALASGQRLSKEVLDEAETLGISDRSIKKARELLGVETKKIGGAWTMHLALETDENDVCTPYP
jgi:hypothetical protein